MIAPLQMNSIGNASPCSDIPMMQYSITGKKLANTINPNADNASNPQKEIEAINQCFDTLLSSYDVTLDEKSIAMLGKSVFKEKCDITEKINIGLALINAVANPVQGPVGVILAKTILDVAKKSPCSANIVFRKGYDMILDNPNVPDNEKAVAKIGKLPSVFSNERSIVNSKAIYSIMGTIGNRKSCPETDLLARISDNIAIHSLERGFKAILENPSATVSQKKTAEMALSFSGNFGDDIRAVILNTIIDDIISLEKKPEEGSNFPKKYQDSLDTEKLLTEVSKKFELEISELKQQTAKLEEEKQSETAIFETDKAKLESHINKTEIMKKAADLSVLSIPGVLFAGPILVQMYQVAPAPFIIPFAIAITANVIFSKMREKMKVMEETFEPKLKHLKDREKEIESEQLKEKAYCEAKALFETEASSEAQNRYDEYHRELFDMAKNISKYDSDSSENQRSTFECEAFDETYIIIDGIKLRVKQNYILGAF